MTASARVAPARSRLSAFLGWLGVVAGGTVAITALHRVGASPDYSVVWGDIWGWLGTRSPEQTLLAFGRLAALAIAYWVVATTLLYTFARAARLPRLVRSVEWATLPMVRRMAEKVVAVSITASTLGGSVVGAGVAPALATEPPLLSVDPHAVTAQTEAGYRPHPAGDGPRFSDPTPWLPVPVMLDSRPDDTSDGGYLPTPAGSDDQNDASSDLRPLPPFMLHLEAPDDGTADPTEIETPGGTMPSDGTRSTAPEREAAPTTAVGGSDQRQQWTVQPGDSLWSIAAARLTDELGEPPSEPQLARYWAELVAVNTPQLRSGNPDLIYPGEVVTLPALAASH